MDYIYLSKQGERKINEDSVMICEYSKRTVFAVADGLGGHGYGEVASKIAVESVKAVFDTSIDNIDTALLLKEAFEKAQEALLEIQAKEHDFSSYKTTLVILVVDENSVQWGYIGDSRLYHFQSNKLIKRTLDHSVPQMLVMTGEIKEKQIRGHADRNRLLRVMGVETDTPKYVIEEKINRKSGQAFLLCSDGFWEWIDEKYMIKYLKKSDSAQMWVELMEKEVIKRGKGHNMDNYSAITIRI